MFFAALDIISAAYCSGSPTTGNFTNDYDIISHSSTVLSKSVKNGKLFLSGPSNARFPIVHVWGTPYEMGYAQGELQKRYITEFVSKTYAYLLNMVVSEMGELISPFFQDLIVLKGMDRALDWCAEITAPYTPSRFYEELQGIADSSGVDYQTLLRLNMFPEITKASCSFFGSWGEASANRKTYQLRALDYDTDGPFKDYPQITVYHPSQEGNAFLNMGWPASIGAITGYSSKKIALSEIGVSFPDDSFGQGTDNTPPEKVRGKPWSFVTRDMLQFSNSLDEAIESIESSDRTCNLIVGVGSGSDNLVKGVEYSGYVAVPYSDTDLLPANDTWHPQVTNVVYNGMDWLCPSYTSVLGEQLQTYHGSIEPGVIVRNILPTVQTGNLHIAVYDLSLSHMYVSFCRSTDGSIDEPLYAYERQFTKLDLDIIFSAEIPN